MIILGNGTMAIVHPGLGGVILSDVMKRHIETTKDGSTTLRVERWDEPYHSVHGAIQESGHVFIDMGLQHCQCDPVRILEIGFGTGLNALLTLLSSIDGQREVSYTAIEAYPVTMAEVSQLNYTSQLNSGQFQGVFEEMHAMAWGTGKMLTPNYHLLKLRLNFMEYTADREYDLVYFDAFGARVQPELWTENLFSRMYQALDDHGILVTYSAKGSVRRAMQAVGFTVERLPGPPGKREMLRATKVPGG